MINNEHFCKIKVRSCKLASKNQARLHTQRTQPRFDEVKTRNGKLCTAILLLYLYIPLWKLMLAYTLLI